MIVILSKQQPVKYQSFELKWIATIVEPKIEVENKEIKSEGGRWRGSDEPLISFYEAAVAAVATI